MLDNSRELVQGTLGQEWGESAIAVHIGRFNPSFAVPGRQVDGARHPPDQVRRFFGRMVHAVVVVLDKLFYLLGAGTIMSVDRSRVGRVQGVEGSDAVRFAQAVQGEFWLVFSASRVAAAQTSSAAPVVVVWSGVGASRPQWDRDAVALRWADGSSVFLWPERAERERLASV